METSDPNKAPSARHWLLERYNMVDVREGLYDYVHNMNNLQAAALVGAIGTAAAVGFTVKVLWEHWHQHGQ
jgi:hypothetical protein